MTDPLTETLVLAAETLRLTEALRIALRALEFYGEPKNWSDDGFGVRAVIDAPDYGDAGAKARSAIKRIDRVTDPTYVPKALRDEGVSRG